MAFENLFIRTKKSIGGIELDAMLSETHTNKVELTTNPVELGVDLTDHAIVQPVQLSVVAQVSDTPLSDLSLGKIVDLNTGLFGTSTQKNITRSNEAYNAMIDLMRECEPIEVQTKLKLYDNMIITHLSTTQDKDLSRVVLMTINLQEVIISESVTGYFDPNLLQAGSTREQAAAPNKMGRKEPLIPNDTTQTSVLKSIINWVE